MRPFNVAIFVSSVAAAAYAQTLECVCSGGTTSASTPMLLIDDPQPDAINMSNGFSYNGQVLGTPYVAAGAPGSGNVYQAEQS
jgi:hypothetical protein